MVFKCTDHIPPYCLHWAFVCGLNHCWISSGEFNMGHLEKMTTEQNDKCRFKCAIISFRDAMIKMCSLFNILGDKLASPRARNHTNEYCDLWYCPSGAASFGNEGKNKNQMSLNPFFFFLNIQLGAQYFHPSTRHSRKNSNASQKWRFHLVGCRTQWSDCLPIQMRLLDETGKGGRKHGIARISLLLLINNR